MIDHRLDVEAGLAWVDIHGQVDDASALAWFTAFVAELARAQIARGVVDTRRLEKLAMTAAGVRHITEIAMAADAAFSRSRWAIVASADEVFGMARMYQILRSESSWELEVFREASAARLWMGIEEPDAS